MVVNREY